MRCPTPGCHEPWALDSLWDLVAEGHALDFDDAFALFKREGCRAFGTRHNVPTDGTSPLDKYLPTQTDAIIEAAYDLLGDDPDGLDAELEDWL